MFAFYEECFAPLEKYHDHEEREKPLLALRFLWFYTTSDFSYKTGRLKGFDVSNLFKLVEDAFCEYVGVDDSRTVWLHGEKRVTAGAPRCILSAGYVLDDVATPRQEKDWMVKIYSGELPSIVPYINLSKGKRQKVDALIAEYSVSTEGCEAIAAALQEFGGDSPMVLTTIGLSQKKGLLKPGFWDALLPVIKGKGPSTAVVPPTARDPRKTRKIKNSRGKLPFRKIPASKETPEEFLAKWERKNLRKKQYPPDMLDWTTGEINWSSDSVYGFTKDRPVPRWIYQMLVTDRRKYEQFTIGHSFKQDSVDRALKKFIGRHPSYFPPGAGTYHEEEETGDMWIERPAEVALQLSLRYKQE